MLLLAMALQHPYTNNNMLTVSRWELPKDDITGVADGYLCHSCYVPRENWQNVLPRGFEDVKSIRELIARKKKLDGSKHASQAAKHTKSK
jgi:hypothetical protein